MKRARAVGAQWSKAKSRAPLHPVVRFALIHPMARTIVAILLFSLSLGGLSITSYADQYVNGGVSWGPNLPHVAHTDVNPLGINLFLEKEVDPAKVEKTLQMVQDAGFKWVRQSFPWNDIEISGKGDFVDRRGPGPWVSAWAKYDRIVEGCLKHGLQIIARLDSPPVWSRLPSDDLQAFPKGPPANYSDYGDFVSNLASRYKGKISYFQIWNEPNLIGEWGGHPINPEEYVALLKIAHDRIKQVDPQAVIITAALAPTAERSIRNLNDVLFLEGMYRAGASKYFDILSTMLYGLGQSPGERRTDLNRLNFSRPILLRRVMEQNGDSSKPIWISEYAWISLPSDFKGDPTKNIWGKSVDEETQGRWLVEGYERAAAEWPWMGVMTVWHFRQPDPIPNEPANYFAIVRDDFTPRPAYNAIKEYSKRFPIADVGAHMLTSPAITYNSTWLKFLEYPYRTQDPTVPSGGYTATIKFSGTELNVVPCFGGAGCDLNAVSVDNGPFVKPSGEQNIGRVSYVTIAKGLAYASHTATIQLQKPPVLHVTLVAPSFIVSRDKPLWNAFGFPMLYALFGLFALASGAYGQSRLGAWAGAALDRPKGRYSEAAREMARNGTVVVGMALLTAIYYKTEDLPLILLSLVGLGLLAFLKPSTGLAAVAFTIPFFWYPKLIGQQHFPVAETLLMLVFGALMARRVVGYLLPRLAARLHFPPNEVLPNAPSRSGLRSNSQGKGRGYSQSNGTSRTHTADSITQPTTAQSVAPGTEVADDLTPARWPARPITAPLANIDGSRTSAVVARQTLVRDRNAESEQTGQARGPAPTDLAQNGSAQGPTSAASQPSSRLTFHASRLVQRLKEWSNEDAFAMPAVALLLVGTLSLFTLADPSFARDSLRAYRWVIIEPVLFYFLITEIISTRRGLWRIADFFVAAAVVVAFIGLGQYVLGSNTLDVQGVSRVYGVYQHPNNLALYLGRVLPFAACIGLFLPWGWRKALYLLAAIPLTLTTFLTYSRGAYMAVVVAIGVTVVVGYVWRSRHREDDPVQRARWVLIGSSALTLLGLLVILIAALLPNLPARFLNLGSGVLRVELWRSSLHMLADHPIFGVGPDQFLNQFQAHYMTPAEQLESYTAHPHNLILDYWLSLGIIGLLILLWLLWRYFREALVKVRSFAPGLDHDPSTGLQQALAGRAITLGLFASMSDFLLHGLVDNSYFLMDLAMIFWMCCGLLQLERWKVGRLEG